MVRKKLSINRYELAILKVIHDSRRPMSINEIAEKAGISWITCRKYIQKLYRKEYIKKNRGKRNSWDLNYTLIFGKWKLIQSEEYEKF